MSTPKLLKYVGLLLLVLGLVFQAISLLGSRRLRTPPWFLMVAGAGLVIQGRRIDPERAARLRQKPRPASARSPLPPAGVSTPGEPPGGLGFLDPTEAPAPSSPDSAFSAEVPVPLEDFAPFEPAPRGGVVEPFAPAPRRTAVELPRSERPERPERPAVEPGAVPEPGSYLTRCPSCGLGFAFSPRQVRRASTPRDSSQSPAPDMTTACACGLQGTLERSGSGELRVAWWM